MNATDVAEKLEFFAESNREQAVRSCSALQINPTEIARLIDRAAAFETAADLVRKHLVEPTD